VFYRPDESFLATEKTSDIVKNAAKKTEEALFSAMDENSTITADQIADVISKTTRTIQRHLKRKADVENLYLTSVTVAEMLFGIGVLPEVN
jgi:predicted HTH transcriptional regulator